MEEWIMDTKLRNFLGGLFGGALGILFCYYLLPATLPVGCILGCVVGWYNKEIVAQTRKSIHNLPSIPRPSLKFMKPSEWSKPTQANTLALVAAACFAALNIPLLAVMGLATALLYSSIPEPADYQTLALFLLGCGPIPLIAWNTIMIRGDRQNSDGRMNAYASLDYHAGALVRNEIKMLFLGQLRGFLWLGLAMFAIVSWVLGIIVLVGTFCLLLPLHVIHFAATRRGHWPNLITTLAVTIFSALRFFDGQVAPIQAWLLALGTGIACGIASVVVYNQIIRLYTGLTQRLPKLELAGKLKVEGFIYDAMECLVAGFCEWSGKRIKAMGDYRHLAAQNPMID